MKLEIHRKIIQGVSSPFWTFHPLKKIFYSYKLAKSYNCHNLHGKDKGRACVSEFVRVQKQEEGLIEFSNILSDKSQSPPIKNLDQ